jgi:hypothetical protein
MIPIRISKTYNPHLRYTIHQMQMKDRASRPHLEWISAQLLKVKSTSEKQIFLPTPVKKNHDCPSLDLESTQDESFFYAPSHPNCEPPTTHL